MTLPVHWYRHDMGGAPVARGVAGDAIALLDACLVNGFNLRTATSVVVSAEVATMTFSSAFGWLQHQVIEVAGATPAALNGEKRVSTVVGNSITFPAPGVANGTATGTITCRTPGLGWSKVFSSANIAVYRAPDIAGTRMFLRVDDTDSTRARARGFETMSDVNTGTGPFPTDAQFSGGLVWRRSTTADTTARPWTLVGDGAGFYYICRASTTSNVVEWTFGDIAPFAGADAFRCAIGGGESLTSDFSAAGLISRGGTIGCFLARASSQLGSSSRLATFSADYQSLEYPHLPNNGLMLRESVCMESGSRARGTIRGFRRHMHDASVNGGIFSLGQVLSATDGYNGLGLCLDGSSSTTLAFAGVVDLVGPW
ncbi:MAG: hypothetical protein ING52_13835 [Burkholderiales bacterium]|nr:hypothetical protein [Burkholderiales bacterium]